MEDEIPWPPDRLREYCIDCYTETIDRTDENGRTFFCCRTCGSRNERRVVMDPAMKSWVDSDGVYWHESAGVFVRNPDGEFLFFRRKIFPVSAFTAPAGHVDAGEAPEQCAIRELREETGLEALRVKHIASHYIAGDSCRRGSDHHLWHAFLWVLDSPVDVTLEDDEGDGEGENAEWLTLEKAEAKDLTYPVRYIISRHAADLRRNWSGGHDRASRSAERRGGL